MFFSLFIGQTSGLPSGWVVLTQVSEHVQSPGPAPRAAGEQTVSNEAQSTRIMAASWCLSLWLNLDGLYF